MPRLFLLAGLSTLATGLPAQEPPRISFGLPTASLAQGFTKVGSVRELDRSHVVLLDVSDRTVHLVDFTAGRATAIGSQGQGPLEYSRPAALLGLPDHRTLVQDPGNARFLELGPDGAAVGVWAPVSTDGRPVALPSFRVASGSWVSDNRGRLYYEVSPKEAGGVGTAVIVRLEVRAARFDTLATVQTTEAMKEYTFTEAGGMVTLHRKVWAPHWHWAVSGEGHLALLDPSPYRVTWVDGTNRTAGPPVTFVPVKVTEADREAFRQTLGQPVVARSGNVGKQEGPPEFPEVMPPFLGQDGIMVAPDGRLWVARSASLADSVERYDVFDAAGKLAARAVLPPHRRVIGFGDGAVYLVRRDVDDVEYLERYAIPR